MGSSDTTEVGLSFSTMPADIHCQVALFTVSDGGYIPTPRDLRTMSSLVLTSRLFYIELSMKHNPDLYAKIFRLMFDIAAVKKRLGPTAVTSLSLASELQERVEVLKRIKTCFGQSDGKTGRWDTMLSTFNRAALMMIENDGRNRHQLLDVAESAGVPALLQLRERTGDDSPNVDLAVFVSLTEFGRSEAELISEPPGRRFAIIDLLQPFVVSESWPNLPDTKSPQHCASVTTVKYFGRRCRFRPASFTLLARLCTVARHKALNKIYSIGSGRTCIVSTMPASSTRFDNEWSSWCFTIEHPSPPGDAVGSLFSRRYSLGTFDGVWEGQVFIPSALPRGITCALPMQPILREFVSVSAEDTVTFEGDEGANGPELARAWFPEGVEIEDNVTSIKVYDPVKACSMTYWSVSKIMETSDSPQDLVVFDTILLGNTEQKHGERHGEYEFHGRVRKSGRVALIRSPADRRMVDLGVWVFHGRLHMGEEFIGDWRNTSTEKYVPAGQGWFQLAKVSNQ